MKRISVGIVDPHPVHAEGVRVFLSHNDRFNVVGIGHSTSDIATICARDRPDFLVTEIDMGGNPFQEILGISLSFPRIKTIVLTNTERKGDITQALAGRARGYVLKNRAKIDLIQAIDLALNDKIYLSPSIGNSVIEIISLSIKRNSIVH